LSSWTDRVLASADTSFPDLPGFPPIDVQQRFVGRSGRAALEEVRPFYETIIAEHPVSSHSVILDFGCGWGRIARFFQTKTIYLADVQQEALDWCSSLGVAGIPMKLDPQGKLPLDADSVDVAYAYSVFSHLSEDAAKRWLEDIARVLKPGGLFVFTVLSLRFLNLVRACHDKPDADALERQIGLYMGSDPAAAIQLYEGGDFAYHPQGGGGNLSGDFYGWAAMPIAWFKRSVHVLDLVRFENNQSGFDQAVIIARKR
jgi:SAM-dependent methyltransferase